MCWPILKIFPCILCFMKSFLRKLFLGSRSSSSPSAGNNDLVYEPPLESHPSASSSYPIEVVVDSMTVKPQHVQSSSQRTDQVSQNSKESGPLLHIFSSKQPTLSCTPFQSPSKPSPSSSNIPESSFISSSVTVKPQHVQSSSQSITNEVSHCSKVSSPVPPTISSTPLQSPSKPSPSSSNIPQSSWIRSSVAVKPQHVQSSSQSITNEVSHSSKVSSPVPIIISSRLLQSPSKSSPSSSNIPQTSLTSSSVTVKPLHVQSSSQSITNEVSHSSKVSSPVPPTISSTPLQSPSKPPSSKSSNTLPHTFSSRSSTSSSNLSPSPSSLKPPVASSRSYASVLKTTEPPSASSSPTSKKPPQSSPSVVPNSSTLGPRQTSTKQLPAFKPILHTAPNNVTDEEGKMSYMYEKGTPLYAIPEDIEGQIKRDIVRQVLKHPLSPSTYKAFLAALLYAEDYYLQKWTDFLLEKVTLKLEKATVYKEKNEHKYSDGSDEKDDKIFVAFEIDSVPQRRPFLLSRDMVYAQPSDKEVEAFQHHPNRKYDISFSFNRVCLKRAHQAVDTAIETSSQNFIFPESVSWKNNVNPPLFDAYHELDIDEFRAVRRILSYPGSPPYLLVGPLISTEVERESGSYMCTYNHTCDALMTRLMEVIPESDMFRANAAFREMDGVPSDILRSCPVKDEMFELDASSTTEPEATIALANFANENTSVIVTGATRNHSGWVRSNMARNYGLRKSYFERLREREPYKNLNPMFITELDDWEQQPDGNHSSMSFY
ncbi:hypothetical protein RGQ29_018388 [Quercus rubra]|uniref:Uncharacterized protein n=1 Tax=Quercus rubra TaxID=3512 RepID=A0AAN7FJ51_QUERU|nr:hypothetical protein RGQ29_018388 [Quercus rubra]